MRFITMIGLALMLTSCSEYGSVPANREVDFLPYGAYYTFDKRTDLCYVTSGGGNSLVFSYVPCSDKVLKAIEEDKERRLN